MKRFQFRLDPLLRHRTAVEEQARRALAELLRRQEAIEQRIRHQQEQLTAGREVVRTAITGRVDLVAMRAQAQNSMHIMREAGRLVLQLAGMRKQVERARRELLERSRERRAIELLKERQHAVWRVEYQRAQQRELDDLAHRAIAEVSL